MTGSEERTGPGGPTGSDRRDTRAADFGPVVVVGVQPGQRDVVVDRAADLAARTGARLVCAYADPASYTVEEESDGSVERMPIDPDGVDTGFDRVELQLERRLEKLLGPSGVAWDFRMLAGDPGRALAHLADHLDALMIVVGTKHQGVGARLEEILTGSIAVHLAHRQQRPVLVVPVHQI